MLSASMVCLSCRRLVGGTSLSSITLFGDQKKDRRVRPRSTAFSFLPRRLNGAEYVAKKGTDPNDLNSAAGMRWRSQMLDAQALRAHDHAGRDVSVTSDQRQCLRISNEQIGLRGDDGSNAGGGGRNAVIGRTPLGGGCLPHLSRSTPRKFLAILYRPFDEFE